MPTAVSDKPRTKSTKDAPMTILRLTAENVKRLSAVEIAPNGAPVVIIAGENEAGKSSVLDAIAMALGGKNLIPSQPIRAGQDNASVTVDLGDYIVTRRFTASGGSLVVTNRDGLKFPSPQALLDGLVGTLTFDPLAFAEQGDKEQEATLRHLAGVDTTDIDDQVKKLYDERTLINRDATQLQGALAKAVQREGVGLEAVDASAIEANLTKADALAAEAADFQAAFDKAVWGTKAARGVVTSANAAVERARAVLEEAETASMEADEALIKAVEVETKMKAAAEKAQAAVPDRTALRKQLFDLQVVNQHVAENQQRARLSDQLREKKAASELLTNQLCQLEEQKAERLASAKFPVKGLGLDDHGVTWNGLPFSQASTAVRVRASVAIGLALNPKLKVLLVRNGNDLGIKNLNLLAEMAVEAGAQLWIERIAGGDGQTTVIIEDGAVQAPAKAVAK